MSAAVQAGGAIYVAGQVALDPEHRLIGEGDYAAQTRQCFRNVEAILAQLGADLADVVSVTAYLADPSGSDAYLAVRGETFPVDPPATTTVVAPSTHSGFLVEVQVIAAAPEVS
jgi:2-iminobutanoate/2-iminopropanoate deaminase